MKLITYPHTMKDGIIYGEGYRPKFSQKDLDFLVENHKKKTPIEISEAIKLNVWSIYRYLKIYDLKIYRKPHVKEYLNKKMMPIIALVLEDYATTKDKIELIAKRHGISKYSVSKWVSKYYLGTPRNENNVIITLQSKINAD